MRKYTLSTCVQWLAALLVVLVPTSLLQAQDSAISEAQSAYNEADFDRAITLFADALNNKELNKEEQKSALQFLGRSYIAKRNDDRAREAIQTLVELEPPIIELNPDIEPPPLMKLYYDVRKELTDSYEIERADPGLQTLAIVDFTNNSLDDRDRMDPLQGGFASLMVHQLSGATDLKVIERERIKWLLEELDLQKEPGRVDQSTAVRTGKLLGANVVMFGSYMKHRNEFRINARLVKVETGEIIMTEQVAGKEKDFFKLAEELSLKVASGINVSLQETQIGARTETSSLDAMLSYSEGLELLEEEDYDAAFKKFVEAYDKDNNYKRALQKAESLKPLLTAAAG
ncbi:MAG: CsgG/HfaB family protein [Rhodothermaceae bacterium]|nr:CsgG/HfaB family protein [Rhodothermaceae bacterium]